MNVNRLTINNEHYSEYLSQPSAALIDEENFVSYTMLNEQRIEEVYVVWYMS